MDYLLELNEDVNALSDKELLSEFKSETPKFGKMHYYPVMADRFSKFRDILFDEVVEESNKKNRVMGAVKLSWIIAIAILDRSKSDIGKKRLKKIMKENWSPEEYDMFLQYIQKESQFAKYFE